MSERPTIRSVGDGDDDRGRAVVPMPILVVLADDHVSMRRTLRLLLDSEKGIRVVAEASDLGAVVDHVDAYRPHVLVLDHQLPSGGAPELAGLGLGFATHVRMRSPATQVVLVTMQEHGAFMRRAIEAGALGLVRKDQAETELLDAVRAAARGERYMSSHMRS